MGARTHKPDLRELHRRTEGLTQNDRRRIVDQAILLLESVYVHRVQKEAMYAVIPVQRLRLMRAELEASADRDMQTAGSDLDFHRQMVSIFTAFRDLHTSYILPGPYSKMLAYVPFLVEQCVDHGRERFIVTRLIEKTGKAHFVPGIEISHWNGMPIRRAIERHGQQQGGSNLDAAFARGLHALTLRPLARALPPDEDWVTVGYRDINEESREARFEWRLIDVTHDSSAQDGELTGVMRYRNLPAMGIDVESALIRNARRLFFAGRKRRRRSTPLATLGRSIKSAAPTYLKTDLPMIFRAYPIGAGRYGYLRIFSFDVTSAEGFVDECCTLLAQLPPDGLVIDVRGNPGGNILAAESLLQLFTPRRIQPMPFQFVNTPLTLELCKHHSNTDAPGLKLGAWVDSIRQSVQTGAPHSIAIPITPEEQANQVGQRFYGRLILITDPLCYSATDIFAAGFQDHQIGEVLGVGGRTGAGGANVWQHALLTALLHDAPGTPFEPLPLDTAMSVSIRRALRVGRQAGALLEDYGVVPDVTYELTRNDVLGNNDDLVAKAVQRLDATAKQQPARVLRLTNIGLQSGQLSLSLTTANLARVDLWVDNRPWHSVTPTQATLVLSAPVTGNAPRKIKALGYVSSNAAEPVASAQARI